MIGVVGCIVLFLFVVFVVVLFVFVLCVGFEFYCCLYVLL